MTSTVLVIHELDITISKMREMAGEPVFVKCSLSDTLLDAFPSILMLLQKLLYKESQIEHFFSKWAPR